MWHANLFYPQTLADISGTLSSDNTTASTKVSQFNRESREIVMSPANCKQQEALERTV